MDPASIPSVNLNKWPKYFPRSLKLTGFLHSHIKKLVGFAFFVCVPNLAYVQTKTSKCPEEIFGTYFCCALLGWPGWLEPRCSKHDLKYGFCTEVPIQEEKKSFLFALKPSGPTTIFG